MDPRQQVEIVCSACGADTLLTRRPKYDQFKKVGETLACASCGHEYASEEDVPFKQTRAPRVFTDADRSARVEVFAEGEQGRLCRHCASYIVNPFTQWCGLHRREVEATDTCAQFKPRPPPEQKKPPPI
jgi:hypothetical protein